jgi:hypothetical protein
MAATNVFLTPAHITYESAMILKNKLSRGNRVNRQYENQFSQTGAKHGQTISIRKPPRYVGRRGATANYEGMNEQFTNLTLSMFGVDMNFTSFDFTLSIDDFRRRHIEPAVSRIANVIDEDGLALYYQVPWMLGTPGTVPNSLATYWQAGAILTEQGAPKGEGMRSLMLGANSMATIGEAKTTLFNPQPGISELYRTGVMDTSGGWEWFEDVNVPAHTVGPLGGTPTVSGGGQTGASLLTAGWTSAAALRLRRGDVFTIAGVNTVNPQSRQSQGRLQMFVVTADFSSDSSGNGTVSIYPPIVPPNADGSRAQFQTVSASPANAAAITVIGAANTVSPQNTGFARDAITLAVVDLDYPPGVPRELCERMSDPDSNISIRFYMYQDGANDVSAGRLDVLYGWTWVYPDLGVRIAA